MFGGAVVGGAVVGGAVVGGAVVGGGLEGSGVTGSLAGTLQLSPRAFVATTSKVYAVPFASPTTGHDVVADVQVAPPGDAVAVV